MQFKLAIFTAIAAVAAQSFANQTGSGIVGPTQGSVSSIVPGATSTVGSNVNVNVNVDVTFKISITVLVGPLVTVILVPGAPGSAQTVIVDGKPVPVATSTLTLLENQTATKSVLVTQTPAAAAVGAAAAAACTCPPAVIATAFYPGTVVSKVDFGTSTYYSTFTKSLLGVVIVSAGAIHPVTPTVTQTAIVVPNTNAPLAPGQKYEVITIPNAVGILIKITVIVNININIEIGNIIAPGSGGAVVGPTGGSISSGSVLPTGSISPSGSGIVLPTGGSITPSISPTSAPFVNGTTMATSMRSTTL